MDIALLHNPIIQLVAAIASLAFGMLQAINTVTRVIGQYHGYIRRVLRAVVISLTIGFVNYQIDKSTGFKFNQVIETAFGTTIPNYIYATSTGGLSLLLGLVNPFPNIGEKMSGLALRALILTNSIVGGIALSLTFTISALILIGLTGIFGGTLPLWALIGIICLGAITGYLGIFNQTMFTYGAAILKAVKSGKVSVSDDYIEQVIEEMDVHYPIAQAYNVLLLIMSVPIAILFFEIFQWVGLLIFVGIQLVVFGLVGIDYVLRRIPTWVLLLASVIVIVAFQAYIGYQKFF